MWPLIVGALGARRANRTCVRRCDDVRLPYLIAPPITPRRAGGIPASGARPVGGSGVAHHAPASASVLVSEIPASASNTRTIVRMVASSAKQRLACQYIPRGFGCLNPGLGDGWRAVAR